MSLPSQPPTASDQPKLDQAKIEYDRLINYFKLLVWITGGALAIVVAAGAFFFGKSIDDVKSQAAAAITATKESAQQTAKTEAQKAIEAELDKSNIQKLIQETASRKVDSAVEAAIQKNLTRRIQNFENETSEIGTLASLATLVKIEAGNRAAGDSLHVLIESQYSQNPPVREFARRSVREIAQWIEETNLRTVGEPALRQRLTQDRPREMIEKITRYPNSFHPNLVWRAFHDMRIATRWDVEVFDTDAAIKWCAEHKSKCDE